MSRNRAGHFVAFTGNADAAKFHRFGSGQDRAAVSGFIAFTDNLEHYSIPLPYLFTNSSFFNSHVSAGIFLSVPSIEIEGIFIMNVSGPLVIDG
jgi:hypothetical protein